MSAELQDLYQDLILDHSRHPSNYHDMPDADRSVQGHNPLCGDELTLFLKLEGDRVADISFQGRGCAISMASTSLLTERVKGLTRDQAQALFDAVHGLLVDANADANRAPLGKLEALAGVRNYPTRVKCATLSWHTLKAALEGGTVESVTTE